MVTSCASLQHSESRSVGITSPAAIEHASADDCAIIAEIGKSELHWSAAKAPEALFYPRFEKATGGPYVEDCSWRKLGLADPTIGTPNSPIGFFITRPVYSASGASAYFQYSVAAVPAADGKKIAPYTEQELCTLEKDAAGWHLIRCKLMAVT